MKSIPKGSDKRKFKEFTNFMYQGVVKGAKTYGDRTYTRLNMIKMAKEEARDLSCYGYFLYLKLCALEKGILKRLKEAK